MGGLFWIALISTYVSLLVFAVSLYIIR